MALLISPWPNESLAAKASLSPSSCPRDSTKKSNRRKILMEIIPTDPHFDLIPEIKRIYSQNLE